MRITPVTEADFDTWIDMRTALWPQGSRDEHAGWGRSIVQSGTFADYAHVIEYHIAIAWDGAQAVGFVEYSKRIWAEGCKTSPVVYVEGLYVLPERRSQKVATQLLNYAEQWGAAQGCREIASDSDADNEASIATHTKFGFERTRAQIAYHKMIST